MATLDVGQLVSDVKTAITGAIGKDINTVTGFAQEQLQDTAKQAELIASNFLTGVTDAAQRDADLERLENIVKAFVEVMDGLAEIEIEKAWNAAVGVIWDAIGKAIGVALPVPKLG
jgi:hypothetical protein